MCVVAASPWSIQAESQADKGKRGRLSCNVCERKDRQDVKFTTQNISCKSPILKYYP